MELAACYNSRMPPLELVGLSEAHVGLLRWFLNHAGTHTGYPAPLDNGAFLVSRPKGIYKPKGWTHALSIRVNSDSPYADGEVEFRRDGTWSFWYHQEGTNLVNPELEYTNRALFACIRDGVPVGVLRQVTAAYSKTGLYEVLGLAVPRLWRAGHFYFEGFGPIGASEPELRNFVDLRAASTDSDSASMVELHFDRRVRALREVVVRSGQGSFRDGLVDAYSGMCAVTGSRVDAVLQAAHLRPYRGDHTNALSNGLLLRADIHILLDQRLLAVDPGSRLVTLAPSLRTSGYRNLEGRRLAEPTRASARPTVDSLDWVWAEFQSA